MLRDALLENLHRSQLNPLEEAAAYQQLLSEFGATHEELARASAGPARRSRNTIRLLSCRPGAAPGRRRRAVGRARARDPRPADARRRRRHGRRVVAEGLSVRGVEEAVQLAQGDAAEDERAARRSRRPGAAGPASWPTG
jgi:ParB family chromosome partitioning protein